MSRRNNPSNVVGFAGIARCEKTQYLPWSTTGARTGLALRPCTGSTNPLRNRGHDRSNLAAMPVHLRQHHWRHTPRCCQLGERPRFTASKGITRSIGLGHHGEAHTEASQGHQEIKSRTGEILNIINAAVHQISHTLRQARFQRHDGAANDIGTIKSPRSSTGKNGAKLFAKNRSCCPLRALVTLG